VTGTDLQPIESALAKALPDVLGSSVDTLNIANVINQLGDVFYQFPFTLPSYYTAIVRCLGVLEGLAIQVDTYFCAYACKFMPVYVCVCVCFYISKSIFIYAVCVLAREPRCYGACVCMCECEFECECVCECARCLGVLEGLAIEVDS